MSTMDQTILETARDLYLDDGLRGVSMRKIASKVGLSATAIYRHYENKEDLLGEVVNEGFKLFSTYLYDGLSGATPEERLSISGGRYLDFALEQSKYYEMMFMAPTQVWTVTSPESMNEHVARTYNFLTDRVRECMEAGMLRKDDPGEVAIAIWAHSHGMVSLYLNGHLGESPKKFREHFQRSSMRLFSGLQ